MWKGASLTAQVVFPLFNNVVGERDYIRPGFLTLRQELRLPHNLFATVTVGNFNANRFGADIRLRYQSGGGLWALALQAGQTGSSIVKNGKWKVSRWLHTSASATLTLRPDWYGLRFDLSAHRFMYGDYGARLNCTRHFGETTIGAYAMVAGGEPNGGFYFAIPLPTQKRPKRKAVRVILPEYFDWEYYAQSGNEYAQRRLGSIYETRADENYSRADYNPAYLKETLLQAGEKGNSKN
jgi:hypothetical protein